MKIKTSITFLLSLLWLSIAIGSLSAGEKELEATQSWLKSLGKESAIKELKSLPKCNIYH